MLKVDKNAADGYRAPGAGEIMRNPTLAHTFRLLAENGKKGFYTGEVAEAIVKVCKDRGGHLEHSDLQNHMEIGTESVSSMVVSHFQACATVLEHRRIKSNTESLG